MPMFQPLKNDGFVLNLEAAVKDGVLGGFEGCRYAGEAEEKFDLTKLTEELTSLDVPSVFICPISLEPMQDPVTLCTGQTYERSNILKWLSLGHYTCPTTMQELWDDALTPNQTLHHLIHSWFSHKYAQMRKRSKDARSMASELVATLEKVKGRERIRTLKELRRVVRSDSNSKAMIVHESGVNLVSSLLGLYTSYVVGCEVVGILARLTLSSESKSILMQPAKVSSIVDILNEGSIETKVDCVRLIETLMDDDVFRVEIVSSHSLLVALMRLARDRKNPVGQLPALRLLSLICTHEQVRSLVVRVRAVPQLVELTHGSNLDCLELALFVLDALSSVPEGRQALKDCSDTIPSMVKLLMGVSERCTEYAVSILLSVWKLDPEGCALIGVDEGLVAKLLLVIQSGCSTGLKQRAAELLKICSLNYSDSILVSKCKLTRTME